MLMRLILSCIFCFTITSSSIAQWNIDLVDNSGQVGEYSSIDYDSSGYPHIAYYNTSDADLYYSKWNGNGWEIEAVTQHDTEFYSGQHCSLILDTLGYPHIAYYFLNYSGYGQGELRYSYKDETGWHHQTVHSKGTRYYVGMYTSIDLFYNSDLQKDIPHISYYDYDSYYYGTIGDLYHAKYIDSSSSWQITRIDEAGNVGLWTSLKVDDQENVYISYCDAGGYDLKFAYFDGNVWSTAIIDTTGNSGLYSSLTLDELGNPHISYYQIPPEGGDGRLVYTTLNNPKK